MIGKFIEFDKNFTNKRYEKTIDAIQEAMDNKTPSR